MQEYIKTDVVAGDTATLEVWADLDCEGPRGHAISAFWAEGMHRRYNFHESAAGDVLERLRGQVPAKYQSDDVACMAWLTEHQTAASDYAAIPVTMYDHGGLAFSEGQGGSDWDSGLIGWLIVDRVRWSAEHGGGWSQAAALECLRCDVRALDDFHQLGAYGYTLTVLPVCECCNQANANAPILDDSCGGFYGSDIAAAMRDHLPDAYKHLIDGWN